MRYYLVLSVKQILENKIETKRYELRHLEYKYQSSKCQDAPSFMEFPRTHTCQKRLCKIVPSAA